MLFKKLFLTIFLMSLLSSAGAQSAADTVCHEVLLATTMGNIRVKLYNDTPLHRDNFLKLVRAGFYDGILFHRVIANFMIQTGDPKSREAHTGEVLGNHSEGEKIPAEIRWPEHWHKRGALAAAREGDDTNPERKSSGSQFYIVYGKRFTDLELDTQQRRLDKATSETVKMSSALREAYNKIGGTPHLDGQYTVFGEVTEGLEVVKQIQWADTDEHDRPREDIRIVKATVVR